MNRGQLIMWSVIADVLDIVVIGQTPIGWVIDLPLIVMHFVAYGPAAILNLLELIPGIGFIPVFTIMALKAKAE